MPLLPDNEESMSLIRCSRDYAVWLDLFIPALREDSSKTERAAKLFHSLLVEIESNPQGSALAIERLENALMVAFSFTPMLAVHCILSS